MAQWYRYYEESVIGNLTLGWYTLGYVPEVSKVIPLGILLLVIILWAQSLKSPRLSRLTPNTEYLVSALLYYIYVMGTIRLSLPLGAWALWVLPTYK